MKIIKPSSVFSGIVLLVTVFFNQAAFANQLIYPLSQNSTLNNPQEFYCTATETGKGDDDTIGITNFAQMITGFNKRGYLVIKASELNQVYFQAYHDPDPNYQNDVGNIVATSGVYTVTCQEGKGVNRHLIKGDFG